MIRDQKPDPQYLAGADSCCSAHMLTMHMEGVVVSALIPASAANEAQGGGKLQPIDWANAGARSAKVFIWLCTSCCWARHFSRAVWCDQRRSRGQPAALAAR